MEAGKQLSLRQNVGIKYAHVCREMADSRAPAAPLATVPLTHGRCVQLRRMLSELPPRVVGAAHFLQPDYPLGP